MITIHTDAAFSEGKAGYAVIIHDGPYLRCELQGKLNDMQDCYMAELAALIKALEHDRFKEPILIYSDCRTLVSQVRSLLKGNEVKVLEQHAALWDHLNRLLSNQNKVYIYWEKGHSSINWNHMCDQRAKHAAYSN
jgi:ribonuclease HI